MNNEIVHAYHGSKNFFDEFNFSECGEHGGNTGAGCGLYFSTSKAEAATFGEIVYTCNLHLKREISNIEKSFVGSDVSSILLKLFGRSYFSNSQKEIAKILRACNTDTEIIAEIVRRYDLTVHQICGVLARCNMTHTLDYIEPIDPTMPHYIVYDLNAIKILGKENIGE